MDRETKNELCVKSVYDIFQKIKDREGDRREAYKNNDIYIKKVKLESDNGKVIKEYMFRYYVRKGKKIAYTLIIFGYNNENFRYKGSGYREYKDMIFQSDYINDNRNRSVTEEEIVNIINFSKEYCKP